MPLDPAIMDAGTIGQLLDEAQADCVATADLPDDIPDAAWFKAKAAGRAEGLALALSVLVARPAEVLLSESDERARGRLCHCSSHPSHLETTGGPDADRALPDTRRAHVDAPS